MKGMTRRRAPRFVLPLCALVVALSATIGRAAGPDCRRGIPPSGDCPGAISSPPGLPAHGGTITVHPGIPLPCIVRLPGGATLCAGGETAAPYGPPGAITPGRAIFRVSGSSLDTPGVNIVVSRSGTNAPNGPELLPRLAADAVVILPRGAVLLRLDPTTGRYLAVPDGRIRLAGDTLYKIVRSRAAPTIEPTSGPPPHTLPATGGSPFGLLLALEGLMIVAGLFLARDLFRRHGAARGQRLHRPSTRAGLLVGSTGLVLAVATSAAYAVMSAQGGVRGFGSLVEAGGPAPRVVFAAGPPTRLVISRLGIDTPVLALRVVNGAWQTPSFAAGYLAGSAWPGQPGNDAITGHDDRDGAVFRRLDEARAGDVIQVYAGAYRYRYAVIALRTIPATQVDVLRPTRGAVLTLVTCAPYLIDTQRLVVRARLLSDR